MTANEMKTLWKSGDASHWELLKQLVEQGYEYPDAEWKVVRCLGLNAHQIAEMRHGYDNA
jgi:hypothetical protein